MHADSVCGLFFIIFCHTHVNKNHNAAGMVRVDSYANLWLQGKLVFMQVRLLASGIMARTLGLWVFSFLKMGIREGHSKRRTFKFDSRSCQHN